MSVKFFDHNKAYKWIGSFWFPSQTEPQKFDGEIKYQPETGITFELLCVNDEIPKKMDHFSKQVMHAAIYGEEFTIATLLNVFVSVSSRGFGGTDYMVLRGSAQSLIANIHLETIQFEKISICYDEHFENIFFSPHYKERDILDFSKGAPIDIGSGHQISMDVNSSGFSVWHPSDINTIFWAKDESQMEKMKKAMTPFFEKGVFYKRNIIESSVVIESKNSSWKDLLKTERIWRSYWELVIDQSISIKSAWLHTEREDEDGEKYHSKNPFLCSIFPNKNFAKAKALPHLILNFYTLKTGAKKDISELSIAIKKWFEINQNPDWAPVFNGIKRILENKHKIIDTSIYVSLISEIETFLDLIEKKPPKSSSMIELYATAKWNEEVQSLCVALPRNKPCSTWVWEVRNAITHPVGAKVKEGGKYKLFVADSFSLQKLYAYVSGLLVKGILKHVSEAKDEIIEKFIEEFIKSRASFYSIDFE